MLENTDLATLESINELENKDAELIQRLDKIEGNINNTADDGLEDRLQALEEVDDELDKRLDKVEAMVNMTSGIDLEERVEALEEADNDLNARIEGIEEEIGPGEGSANDSLPECYGGYTTLTGDHRRVGEDGETHRWCDSWAQGEWYRFNASTGENGLLDSCPVADSCGSYRSIWMTTAHPKVIGQRLQSKLVVSSDGDCDISGYGGPIEVTKCYVGGEKFYLYNLQWGPPQCHITFCITRYDDI